MKITLLLLTSIAIGVVVNFLALNNNTYALSTSYINDHLYGGVSQAKAWDDDCYSDLRYYRSKGYSPRNAINTSNQYRPFIWLSGKDKASQTTPIEVDYGTKTIPLQINFILYLCSGLTAPYNKGADYSKTFNNGVVTSSSDANDRTPGNGVNDPAATRYGYKIQGISIVQGAGVITDNLSGRVIEGTDNNTTRYWFGSPIGFNYFDSAGIKAGTTIKVKVDVKGMVRFRSGRSAAYACTTGGPVPPSDNYAYCSTASLYITVQVAILPYFVLNPVVTLDRTSGEVGDSVGVTGSVNNSGTKDSSGANWQLSRFVVPPAISYNPTGKGGMSNVAPSSFYGYPVSVLGSGSGVVYKNNTITKSPNPSPSDLIPDLPVGTKVCYALSVQPYMATDSRWNHSDPSCLVIAKKPKFHVLGGDLVVGRGSAYNLPRTSNVTTSVSTRNGKFYGSWAEYAIAASGLVNGMASGAGLVGGAGSGDLCGFSILTFTNVPAGGTNCSVASIGLYSQNTIAPNVATRFPIRVSASDASLANPANPAITPTATLTPPTASLDLIANNLSGVYQAPKDVTSLTITGGNQIPKGRFIVINAPNTTITITGNITYTNALLNSLSDIPQVVLIAKNIIIADSVTQVDAWLVAVGSGVDGRINTCGAGGVSETSDLTYTTCNQQLTINGPVVANHLILRRTAGAGTGSDVEQPAEVINLRPDAYLWVSGQNLNKDRLPTVSTKELPPRF